MRTGAGRAGGLTDVVRAQLERWQDHPNTGRVLWYTDDGGFTRRRGWYRTNDVRTAACERDMEIWIPKDYTLSLHDALPI